MNLLQPTRRCAHLMSPTRLLVLGACALLTACGGGGNPLANPADVANPAGTGGTKLSFEYFQRCIQPLLVTPLAGPTGTNTCAASGCHSNANGTGGALRIIENAALVDLADAANTAEKVRATEMYRNYYSSLGVSVAGDASQSRLLTKPLVNGVLHGGGVILASDQDPAARLMRYWIEHPAPAGQDEFSSASWALFTPADPATGTCNTGL